MKRDARMKGQMEYWGLIFTVLSFAFLIVFLLGFFAIVPAGSKGILLEWGKVKGELNEGFNFKIPIMQDAVIMSVQTQKYETNSTSASSDLQDVHTTIALNYKVQESTVTDLYRNVGIHYESSVIDPAVQESVKASTASYTAEELITKRESVKSRIQDALSFRLLKYGIEVQTVSITDFKFSDQFTTAIEAKVTAEQNALKAQNDLTRIKTEAEQQIAIASGQANATLTKALAEATAIKIQGDALRENSQVVSLRMI